MVEDEEPGEDADEGEAGWEGTEDLVLDTPEPPPEQAFAQFDDYRAEALLAANGIDTAPEEVRAALGSTSAVLQGAAAHAAGSQGLAELVPDLERLAAQAEDLVRVEAAYALVRLGRAGYREVLRAALADPVAVRLGPPVAAGDLARLGDPVGFPVVRACLAEDNLIVRVGGCKQLIHFVPHDGQRLADGSTVDAVGLLERTTRDPDPEVSRIARLQWDETGR